MIDSLPSPADLRRAVRHWRRSHRTWILAGLGSAIALWIVTVPFMTSGADGEGTSPLRWPLTVAAAAGSLTAIVGLAAGHMAVARLRWPGHFIRLPGLIAAVWRDAPRRSRPAGVGVVVGLVTALFLHPAVVLGPSAAAVGLTVTAVGLAVLTGVRDALAAWRGAPTSPQLVAILRPGVLAAGLAAGVTGLTRLLLLEVGCVADRLLGAPCGASNLGVIAAAVVGGIAVMPLFMTLGALVSLTLDGQPLGEIGRTPRAVGPGGSSPDLDRSPEIGSTADVPDATSSETAAPEPSAIEPPRGTESPRQPTTEAQRSGPRDAVTAADDAVPMVGPDGSDQEALAATAALAQVDTGPLPRVVPSPRPAQDDAREVPVRAPDTPPVPEAAPEEEENEPTLETAAVEDAEPAPAAESVGEVEPALPPDPSIPLAPIPGPDPDRAPVTDRRDAVIAEVAEHLDRLSPDARAHAEPLLEALEDLGPERIREVVDQVAAHEGTIATLRAQYRRAPGIAKGAIERACTAGLRTAGVGGERAAILARTLLRLDGDEWRALQDVLASLDDHLAAPDRRDHT